MRGFFAALFVLFGALFTFPASIAVWEQRVLTDREAFIELGQEVLLNPAVQERLSQRITEEALLIAAANGYTFPENAVGGLGRSQVEALTRAVVRQLPESPVGERALISSHEALLAVIDDDRRLLTASDDEVRINFRPVLERVLDSVEAAIPGVAEIELPPGTGEFLLIQEQDLALAFRAARWFDGAAWYIALVPVVCFGLALTVAANRQMALFLSGLTIILAAGLRILLYEGPLRRIVLDTAVDDPELKPAAGGVYDAVAASLIAQEMLLLIAGIALIVFSIGWWGLKRAGL